MLGELVNRNLAEDARQAARETITAREAAKIIGVSEWTIYDLARRHVIPHIRVGRRVLFRRSGLLAWLEQQEAASLKPEPVQFGKIRKLHA
ncbi:helix-turn-helix domain-containing protein [Neomoorella thermoacetica]|uniref:helix-turn-helix domain-containing protein n=1 Tax=Neomoorella thermoacetica TaxID=1525 RepID=UPI000472649A|nr:helix-turn-helix domain-containing protein [Moorella thermoacetica]OIQ12805.1 helix-turn-helix domain protein [Moorella thermoacetica]